ncbi:tetratricopeptide repeat protein 39C-like [Paramacrobiotus metropolitanus]|uniref:tetratricopeptide repeat protein 39C-like n=1 Tax=Paramacrobiotus metropolitanus TaxID=2943436 RepID=UPI0024456635|nr:tetratricopeptide repeat protein 39C-like [Paramacrobiotus metropolitanus]XP_055354652.1 tetratricopeptide repeat protein 39C-like [Paramacrobiotus metropolitanus]XP_055354654.1 tetratricopeptide repeat protein 39C-like [Paramacrobiotus metropolitanus]
MSARPAPAAAVAAPPAPDSEGGVCGQAMRLVFSARFEPALKLLTAAAGSAAHADSASELSISATRSFVIFTQALISYEASKITEAINAWKETERLCTVSKDRSVEDKLEKRIILADAKICATFLGLLQSADFGGLFKGGWQIRQAWKLYQSTYNDMLKLIDAESKSGTLTPSQVAALLHHLPTNHPHPSGAPPPTEGPHKSHKRTLSEQSASVEKDDDSDEDEFVDALCEVGQLTEGEVKFGRLGQILGAVCYGFGCFHLMLSLLPPSLLKWLRFLGFEGDLRTGIQALTYCMYSSDWKALLARMTLVWFHTIIQTYYSVQEHEMEEGIARACAVLDGLDAQLRTSPLIRFFDCRLKRFGKDIDGAINGYENALAQSEHVRDFNVLLHHEFGILRFQLHQWDYAVEHLNKCFEEGRWGKSLYGYMLGIVYVMMGEEKKARDLIARVPSLNVLKNAPLEMFLAERAVQLAKEPSAQLPAVASLLAMEICYFINCPQYVPPAVVHSLLADLSRVDKPAYLGLRYLMEGRLMEMQNVADLSRAAQCYREAIKQGDSVKGAEHVPAFASYELGVLLSKSPATEKEGRTLLNKAGDSYKNCHFRNRLHMRVHLAKKAFGQ